MGMDLVSTSVGFDDANTFKREFTKIALQGIAIWKRNLMEDLNYSSIQGAQGLLFQ